MYIYKLTTSLDGVVRLSITNSFTGALPIRPLALPSVRVEEFQKAKLRFNCTNVHEYTTQYIAGDHCYLSFFYETRNPLSINHDIGILQYIVDAAQLVVLGELRNESLAVCRIWACAVENA